LGKGRKWKTLVAGAHGRAPPTTASECGVGKAAWVCNVWVRNVTFFFCARRRGPGKRRKNAEVAVGGRHRDRIRTSAAAPPAEKLTIVRLG
jgi:hypothetical protein